MSGEHNGQEKRSLCMTIPGPVAEVFFQHCCSARSLRSPRCTRARCVGTHTRSVQGKSELGERPQL
eukprot:10706246-Alexandrium_andersonii.AAC.1